MTIDEFSNGFDTLLNSYSGDVSIELDEYEKTYFLNAAQDQIVKELYSSANGVVSFESTEEIRRSLDTLVETAEPDLDSESSKTLNRGNFNHYVFSLPKDCWYIVYEELYPDGGFECEATQVRDVLPVTHDDYHRVSRNPFRGPLSNRALRLDKGEHQVEIVVKDLTNPIYRIRYVRQPKPIRLTKFPMDSTFNYLGEEEPVDGSLPVQGCELPEVLHQDILERAVQLAIASKHLYSSNGK